MFHYISIPRPSWRVSFISHISDQGLVGGFSFIFTHIIIPGGYSAACSADIKKFHRTTPIHPSHKACPASSNSSQISGTVVAIWRKLDVAPVPKCEDDFWPLRTIPCTNIATNRKLQKGRAILNNSYCPHVLASKRLETWSSPYVLAPPSKSNYGVGLLRFTQFL